MSPTDHPLAVAWLERVEHLAVDLPPEARAELLLDLREHLDVAVPPGADGATVGAALDRLGDPVDVVAAARESAGFAVAAPAASAPDRLVPGEVGALVVFVLAGLTLPIWPLAVVLWLTGVVLLFTRGRWRGGEVVAMLLLPVGWTVPALSALVSLPMIGSVTSCTTGADGVELCQTIDQGPPAWLVPLALVLVVAGLALWTRELARRPRGRPLT